MNLRTTSELTVYFRSLLLWSEWLEPRTKKVVGGVGNQQFAVQILVACPEARPCHMFRAVDAVKHNIGAACLRSFSGFIALLPTPEADIEHHVHAKFKTSWPKQTDLIGYSAGLDGEQVAGGSIPKKRTIHSS